MYKMSKVKPKHPLLGVNIDHVATVRNARGVAYPDPLHAALMAEQAGADGITLHLREDRRHILERDVSMIKDALLTRMNLECAPQDEMVLFAQSIRPEHCCLVPEKREELTTEGGLNVRDNIDLYKKTVERLVGEGIDVSLFIDPEPEQIDAAKACGAGTIELHTGVYADAKTPEAQAEALTQLMAMAAYADEAGLVVNAGHGLHYHNVTDVARIPHIHELNIGHAIIARAIFVGLTEAVKQMKTLLVQAWV
jgi:pyridoxine 5-phosphate synthase